MGRSGRATIWERHRTPTPTASRSQMTGRGDSGGCAPARWRLALLGDQLKGQAQGLGSLDQPLIGAGNREALALGHGQMQGITTYAAAEIAAGVLFIEANIRIVRPGDGAPPHLFEQLLGRQARQDYSCGTSLSLDQLL